MALSDACFEFLMAHRDAAKELAELVHWYSAPDYPLDYGEEADALRRACRKVAENDGPFDIEAAVHLLRLSHSVMRFLDSFDEEEAKKRHAEMIALIRLLQTDLVGEDASDAPSVVRDLTRVEPSEEQAKQTVSRFKGMLSKLGKGSYDTAVKIAGDVASAAIKKHLGF